MPSLHASAVLRPLLIAALLLMNGCKPRDPLGNVGAIAASPTGGRVAAAGELVRAFNAKEVLLSDAIDASFAAVELAETDPTSSLAATAYAGAVLDAALAVEGVLPKDGEFEIFWFRLGGLAFKAAEEAFARGRLVEARSLVLAGPDRWQNESYWRRHSAHDALAAVILAQSGEGGEALRRLGSRADLDGPALDVYEQLGKRR